MDFNELFNRLWGFDGVHPFGDPFRFEEFMNQKTGEVEVETFEVIKGDFKTIITARFNKQGFLLGTSSSSEYIGDAKESLEDMLKKALEKEDYLTAAAIKKKMDEGKSEGE